MFVRRIDWIDHCRALAVMWMIIFHFTYDLRIFGLPSISTHAQWYWHGFPTLIVATFMFSMGLSLDFAKTHGKLGGARFWKRWLKIAVGAGLVSFGTWLTFPERWVYFGTLHSIAACSLLVWPFLNRPRLSLLVALIILSAELSGFTVPWFKLSHPSMDYIPPFPWVSYALLGVAFRNSLSKTPAFQNWPKIRFLSLLGRHSLKIYLLHQPTLIFIVWCLSKLNEVFDGG